MKLIHKLNHFFIAEDPEEVSRHDALWFYGSFALMGAIIILVSIMNWVTGV